MEAGLRRIGLWPALAWVCVAAGVLLRLRDFFFRRALWLDELLLAVNIVGRGFGRLTQPLDYYLGAPIGFLWLERASVQLFGSSEYALRIVPLLAGIASIPLFYRLAGRLLAPPAATAAVALFSLSPALIYYSTEAKQYALDVLAVLIVLTLAESAIRRPATWRSAVTFSGVGAALIWFSHPALFAVAGVAAVIVVRLVVHRDRAGAVRWMIASGIWLASLLGEYVLSLRDLSNSAPLSDYWASAFPRAGAGPAGVARWAVRTTAELVTKVPGFERANVTLVLALVGIGVLAWRRAWLAAVLCAPLALGLTAAAVSAYPIRERLALFTVPTVVLLLAAVLEPIRERGQVIAGAGVLVLLALVGPVPPRHARGREETRPVLEAVAKQRRPGDALYALATAELAVDFYGRDLGLTPAGVLRINPDMQGCATPTQLAAIGGSSGRVWTVYSHPARAGDSDNWAPYEAWFAGLGRVADVVTARGAKAVLVVDVQSGSPRSPVVPGGCLVLYRSFWDQFRAAR